MKTIRGRDTERILPADVEPGMIMADLGVVVRVRRYSPGDGSLGAFYFDGPNGTTMVNEDESVQVLARLDRGATDAVVEAVETEWKRHAR